MRSRAIVSARRRTAGGVSVPDPVFPASTLATPDVNSWYVATTGNDTTGTGAVGAPYATVQKAVTEATASATRKTIFVRGGRYQFSNHIYMPTAASGISIIGYPDETAVLSYGEQLTGFTSLGSGLYAKSGITATGIDLTIGTKRARVAQSGTLDPSSPFGTGWLLATAAATPSTTAFRYGTGEVPTLASLTGTMVQVFGGYPIDGGTGNVTTLQPVTAIDTGTRTITFGPGAHVVNVPNNGIYRILNNSTLIRNDREFGWDGTNSRLVIKAESADFESEGVYVHRTGSSGRFFELAGGTTGINLLNLTFAHNPYTQPAILQYGAEGTKIGGCRFLNCGAAITTSSGNNMVIAGNVFEGTAKEALYVGDDVSGTTIYANTFRDISMIFPGGAGMYAGTCANTKVLYNDVWGTGYTAFSIKGVPTTGHTSHTISHNWINRTNRWSYDTGSIEFLNRAKRDFNTTVEGNWINDPGGIQINAGTTPTEPYRVSCIYLDDLSQDVTMKYNFLRGAVWGQIFVHGGDNNVGENNFHIMTSTDNYVTTMHGNGNVGSFAVGTNLAPDNNTFQKNIYYSATNRTAKVWNLGGLNPGNVINQNVYHNMPKLKNDGTDDTSSTNDVGFDTTSIVQNPLFDNPTGDVFTLQSTSPAFGQGILNLPWVKMGVFGYTHTVATAEGLPRFWQAWTNSPRRDAHYRVHLGMYSGDVLDRTSAATYYGPRGFRTVAPSTLPRFDHNPGNQDARGILVEPAATNLLNNSTDLTSASWTKNNAGTATAGGGISLDGTNNLSVYTKAAAGTAGVTPEQGSVTAYVNPFPAGSPLTATVRLKRGTTLPHDWVYLAFKSSGSGCDAFFNINTGVAASNAANGTAFTFTSSSITHLARGIYELTFTVATNTITDSLFQINPTTGDAQYWGIPSGTILFDSAQVEVGTMATSYIPTTAGIVTRVQENLLIPLVAGTYDILIQDAEGSEWRLNVTPVSGYVSILPRSGQRHVARMRAWKAGVLSQAQRNNIAVTATLAATPSPSDDSLPLLDSAGDGDQNSLDSAA